MNSKNIAMGITIFGAGLGLGYFICNKRLSKRYQEDVAEVKEFYMEKIKRAAARCSYFNGQQLSLFGGVAQHCDFPGIAVVIIRCFQDKRQMA